MIKILILLFVFVFVFILFFLMVEKRCTSKNHRIVCTLTTIPERVDKGRLEKTLESLDRQTLQPNIIILNIPKTTTKGQTYDMEKIQKLVKKYKNIKLNIIETDLGPITKIIPTLEFVRDIDKVVIVDDDIIYDKNIIKTLYEANLPAVGFYGRNNLIWTENKNKTPILTDLLETYGGVMYNGDIIKDMKADQSSICKFQDDIVIGKHLKDKNISPVLINSSHIKIKYNSDGTPQLRDSNLVGGNEVCYNYLFA